MAPTPAALTRKEIIEKLNTIPTFALLSRDKSVLAISDGEGGECCCWFTDPKDAQQVLKMGIEDQPDGGTHLGVTPLGVAFAVCAGWTVGEGEKRGVPFKLQGSTAFVNEVAPMLREQLQAQGLEAGTWQLPLFCCDELESPNVLPIFLSRADLVETWVASGRKREDLPENLTVMDLRILVKQMQTDSFAWSTVQFVGSSLAVEMVKEAKEVSARLDMDTGLY